MKAVRKSYIFLALRDMGREVAVLMPWINSIGARFNLQRIWELLLAAEHLVQHSVSKILKIRKYLKTVLETATITCKIICPPHEDFFFFFLRIRNWFKAWLMRCYLPFISAHFLCERTIEHTESEGTSSSGYSCCPSACLTLVWILIKCLSAAASLLCSTWSTNFHIF